MKRHRNLLLAVLVFVLVVPAASAQVSDSYVITAAASQPGAGSTNWLTRLSLFNPQTYALKVSVIHLPTGIGSPHEVFVVIDPNESLNIDDPLRQLFNLTPPASGALLVSTFAEDNPAVPDNLISRAFLVTSQTFNNVASGTYGQTIEGTTAGLLDTDYDGITAVTHGVVNFGIPGLSGSRANIGAVNLGGISPGPSPDSPAVRLLVTVRDTDGRLIADKIPFRLAGMSHFQDRLPVAVNGGSVEFFVDDPWVTDVQNFAVVFPYVSVADNKSGDPTYLRPILLATQQVVYPKGALALDLGTPGTKIDAKLARRVRDHARKMGPVPVQ